ncbi:MAG: hypothetical protein HY075_13475 [Deltaproteobacteria bacterium]|nr:hypothetical protein [Deltaproteobacteria bacterium]
MSNLCTIVEGNLYRLAAVHDHLGLGAVLLRSVDELVASDKTALFLVDQHNPDGLQLVATRRLSDGERHDLERLPSGSQVEQTLTQRSPLVVKKGETIDLYVPVVGGSQAVGCLLILGLQAPPTDELTAALALLATACGTVYRHVMRGELARDAAETRAHAAETRVQDQQKALVQSAKLSALGRMAGGIAHEINNPLTVIYGKAAQLLALADENSLNFDAIRAASKKIEAMAQRIAKIIQGMRSVVREGVNDTFEIERARDIVEDTLSCCSAKFANNGVELRVSDVPETLDLECSAAQIAQVLLNLLTNAYDAVAELPVRWISLEVLDLDDQIELRITDSGQGIPPHVRDRVFDAFFTTKEPGKGTGLGLSISHGIVAVPARRRDRRRRHERDQEARRNRDGAPAHRKLRPERDPRGLRGGGGRFHRQARAKRRADRRALVVPGPHHARVRRRASGRRLRAHQSRGVRRRRPDQLRRVHPPDRLEIRQDRASRREPFVGTARNLSYPRRAFSLRPEDGPEKIRGPRRRGRLGADPQRPQPERQGPGEPRSAHRRDHRRAALRREHRRGKLFERQEVRRDDRVDPDPGRQRAHAPFAPQ